MGRETSSNKLRTRKDLSGEWERWIGNTKLDYVPVPSSYRPIGTAALRRTFQVSSLLEGKRAVLRFEGIAYRAQVSINGSSAGEMGPWTPYEFDITEYLEQDTNDIAVEINDWQVPLGPSNAWEACGGIIRDVFIEIRNDVYIENARLLYDFDSDYSTAHCSLTVFVKSSVAGSAQIKAELLKEPILSGHLTIPEQSFAGAVSGKCRSHLLTRWAGGVIISCRFVIDNRNTERAGG